MAQTTTYEVDLDSRQRLPLARILGANNSESTPHRFRITALPGGDFLITPIVSISERELSVLQNPATMALIAEGVDAERAGRTTKIDLGMLQKAAAVIPDEES